MTKHITIATAQISRVDMSDPRHIDITIKSGTGPGAILAPTWALVAGYKLHRQLEAGEEVDPRWRFYHPISWKEYTEAYLRLLRERYRAHETHFLDLLDMSELVLCCYCQPEDDCHRHLAADILMKIALHHCRQITRLHEPGSQLDWHAIPDLHS